MPWNKTTLAEAIARTRAAEIHCTDGCIEYPKLSSRGYGIVYFEGTQEYAHRLIYQSVHGPIPDGTWVLHHCDNRACHNPHHLYAGTYRQNIDDKLRRDRSGRKLKIADVIAIRERAVRGAKQGDLAKEYGVNQSNISRALSGERWGYVSPGGVSFLG